MPAMPTTNTAIAAAQRILLAVQEEAAIAELIHNNDPRALKISSFDRQNVLRTQGVYKTWKSIGRQVLAMHPEVVDEVKIASSDKIPGSVLRVLPYINPLVVFADPPIFNTWIKGDKVVKHANRPEDKMRLLGFFTYGTLTVGLGEDGKPNGSGQETGSGIIPDVNTKGVGQMIYGTNDPEANRFGMVLVSEILDQSGKAIDIELNSVTVYFDQEATLNETVESLMGRYHWHENEDNVKGAKAHHRKWMRDVLSTVIGSLFYLCSTTLEAEKVPTKATRNMGRGISRKPLSLFRVGWSTGAALTRYRHSNHTDTPSLTHQERDPEHRRGHFKMQPYGPKKTLRKLIYISPYWTHLEKLGEEGVNLARSVPRVDGKGSARESVRHAMGVK